LAIYGNGSLFFPQQSFMPRAMMPESIIEKLIAIPA
jgi:hypothetical protein